MKTKEVKPMKLINRYQNTDVVYCTDINDVIKDGNYNFVKVYKQENPNRLFLVNLDAFNVVKNK